MVLELVWFIEYYLKISILSESIKGEIVHDHVDPLNWSLQFKNKTESLKQSGGQ